jgi:hypothetical protein
MIYALACLTFRLRPSPEQGCSSTIERAAAPRHDCVLAVDMSLR